MLWDTLKCGKIYQKSVNLPNTKFTEMAKHKTLGQVFTPNWIIKEILDLVGYNNESILDKYILEPASGDGAFLLEIVSRYINVCMDKNGENPRITPKAKPKAKELSP